MNTHWTKVSRGKRRRQGHVKGKHVTITDAKVTSGLPWWSSHLYTHIKVTTITTTIIIIITTTTTTGGQDMCQGQTMSMSCTGFFCRANLTHIPHSIEYKVFTNGIRLVLLPQQQQQQQQLLLLLTGRCFVMISGSSMPASPTPMLRVNGVRILACCCCISRILFSSVSNFTRPFSHISQNSVVTPTGCGENFNDHYLTYCMPS